MIERKKKEDKDKCIGSAYCKERFQVEHQGISGLSVLLVKVVRKGKFDFLKIPKRKVFSNANRQEN